MAYLRIDNPVLPVAIFQTVIGFLKRVISRSGKANGKSSSRLTDTGALEAFSRLSDEQLGDIGVYRKVRKVEWDPLSRPLHPEKTVIFDYFRLGD